jgi:hypothetical protein
MPNTGTAPAFSDSRAAHIFPSCCLSCLNGIMPAHVSGRASYTHFLTRASTEVY